MSDLALQWDDESQSADLAIEVNDLVREEGLRTAVMLSLFLDRQAEKGDALPRGETDRRGWWADAFPVVDGDHIGSRLWLLARETVSETTRRRAEQYALEALQWLIDDKVAETVQAVATSPRPDSVSLEIIIQRPDGSDISYRFDHVWGGEG